MIKRVIQLLALAAGALGWQCVPAQEAIKVGILHSLSGTMAISETVLKDTVLMAIDEINAKGGVLGKKLEPVVVDPASNWPLFAEKAKQLITQDKVAVVFGCWTSVCRKSVLPVFEETDSLLFYPVQYEGEELSKNVFYTGAAPNQQAIPAVEYLMSKDGGSAKRFVLLGTDYVYPRTTNKILRAFLKSKGVAEADIMEEYTPFGHSDYQGIIAKIKKFSSEGKKTAVVSTINGDSNVPFFKELGNQGLKATDVPVMAFSVGEEELRGVDTKPLVGHLAARNYFMSIKSPANTEFVKKWSDYAKAKGIPGHKDKPLTNDPMEATYIGVHMWAQAANKAKSTDTDKVIAAMAGQTFKSPGGFTSTMDIENHHLHKPVFIGEVKADGQFNVVWKTPGPVVADPWSDYIPENKGKTNVSKRIPVQVTGDQAVRIVDTYYATDRSPSNQAGPLRYTNTRSSDGLLNFGMVKVSVPPNKPMGEIPQPAWWRLEISPNPKKHMVLLSTQRMSSSDFIRHLKSTGAKRSFVFVHGYNVSFEDAALRTAQLAVDLDPKSIPIFYSWPSQAGLLKYTVDWTNIEWTKPHLQKFLQTIAEAAGIDEICVIAHSMGSNAATRAMVDLLQDRPDLRPKFRELVLAAPDIDADVFRAEILPRFAKLTSKVTLYASDMDKALKASVRVHGYNRLGLAGRRLFVAKGLETIDVGRIDTDWLGHSAFANERQLLTDMTLLIANRMRAGDRPALTVRESSTIRYWEMRP